LVGLVAVPSTVLKVTLAASTSEPRRETVIERLPLVSFTENALVPNVNTLSLSTIVNTALEIAGVTPPVKLDRLSSTVRFALVVKSSMIGTWNVRGVASPFAHVNDPLAAV